MYEIENGIPGSKSLALQRAKSLVASGASRREAAKAIYVEYFNGDNVQPSQYDRRLNYLVGILAR
ncbi:MAG: hypothetical protein ACK4RZ_11975 [Paracoccaceae bacterium]